MDKCFDFSQINVNVNIHFSDVPFRGIFCYRKSNACPKADSENSLRAVKVRLF